MIRVEINESRSIVGRVKRAPGEDKKREPASAPLAGRMVPAAPYEPDQSLLTALARAGVPMRSAPRGARRAAPAPAAQRPRDLRERPSGRLSLTRHNIPTKGA
jgi:hypothetical protein